MAKYVKYWNVGSMKQANAYYGSKMITRRRRRKKYNGEVPVKFQVFVLTTFLLLFLLFAFALG